MIIFGADFSGAQNPSKGIYYAEGDVQPHSINIKRIIHCEDRLDLLYAIHTSASPWGLDFPFSLPRQLFTRLNLNDWEELLQYTSQTTRSRFFREVTTALPFSCEKKCREPSDCCRHTDGAVNAFSPLKQNNPNMLAMTYAGLKFLYYLRNLGNAVFPFDTFDKAVSRLYEVYPSYTWSHLHLPRSSSLEQLIPICEEKYGLQVNLEMESELASIDAADAAVACITLGLAFNRYRIEENWHLKTTLWEDKEWDNRFWEGLVLMQLGTY